MLPLHLGLKALPFSKLRTSELRSLPLGPPSTVQHASQSPNPEGRGRTGLTEDGDASPGHASSALADLSQSPGRSVRIPGEAGKSCQASGAIRGEWMSEALPLRHLDRGPARKAQISCDVLARPIVVNIHLGFCQKQCFPRSLRARGRLSPLPHRIACKLRCWKRVATVPSVLVSCHVQTASLRMLVSDGSPWWTGRLGLDTPSRETGPGKDGARQPCPPRAPYKFVFRCSARRRSGTPPGAGGLSTGTQLGHAHARLWNCTSHGDAPCFMCSTTGLEHSAASARPGRGAGRAGRLV